MNGSERPVVWLGSCRRDLRSFPREVRREIGAALYAAQQGDTDPAAKPMKGFGGASVLEIVSDYRGDTWRAIYTIRFRERLSTYCTCFRRNQNAGLQRQNTRLK